MLGSVMIGPMENVSKGRRGHLYEQDHVLILELKNKIVNQLKKLEIQKSKFNEYLQKVEEQRNYYERDLHYTFYTYTAQIEEVDFDTYFAHEVKLPFNQGSMIALQKVFSSYPSEIINTLCFDMPFKEWLVEAEKEIQYYGPEDEGIYVIDIYCIIKEACEVGEKINEQLENYLVLQEKLLQDLTTHLAKMEKLIENEKVSKTSSFIKLFSKKESLNFYELSASGRQYIKETFELLQQCEKVNKLPLYRGSSNENYLFMIQLLTYFREDY